MTTLCNTCGSTLTDDVNFCPKCGTPSSSSPTSSSQADMTTQASSADVLYPKGSTDYGFPPYEMLEKNPYEQSPYGLVPPPPPRQGRSRFVISLLSSAIVALLILGGFGTFAMLTTRGGSSSGSPTSFSPLSTPLRTSLPTPTPTPASIVPGTILYQADWSHGMDGWPHTSGWNTLNGILSNDGTGSAVSWLPAAYQPSVSDYALETEMRIDQGCGSHGVVARAVGSDNYAAGAWCAGGMAQIWEWSNNAQYYNPLGTQGFAPGNEWHTYRLEVKGNTLRLRIDGVLMFDVINNALLTPGRVGLWSEKEQLEVRSFIVYSL